MRRFFEKYAGLKIAILALLVGSFFVSATLTMQPKKAEAICCSDCCICILDTITTDLTEWLRDWIEINIHFFIELFLHRLLWWDLTYWQQYMLPMFVQAGNQVAASGTQQVMAIGQFFDAREQMERQRTLQVLHAKANRDYHPSKGMCEFGTRMKSLAATERKGELSSLLLSERSLDRLLGNKDTGVAWGERGDVTIRLANFRTKFCDQFDNNNSLALVCPTTAYTANPNIPSVAVKDRFNKDIDYQRTLDNPLTIGVDFTDFGPATEGEEEIMALQNNLYGYNGFNRADYKKLRNGANLNDLQKAYLDMRSVVAKTKVAENSFNALVALKGEGTVGSKEFLEAYLYELGMDPFETNEFLGQNPSYHAQMEILTKTAYQSPLFYTNLYDKEANVQRKGVAMQAIGLIQKFDLLKSNLRTEASLSILLELAVEQLQQQVEDNIRAFGSMSE